MIWVLLVQNPHAFILINITYISMNRVPTAISGLDELIEGGFIENDVMCEA